MPSEILKPLAIFCAQAESQRYIKNVRNLGDSWRTLTEESVVQDSDPDTASITTTFDLVLRINNHATIDQLRIALEVPSLEATTTPITTIKDKKVLQPRRHYRIFVDYGTDFIWLNNSHPEHPEDPGDPSYIDSTEALAPLPQEVLDNYDAWVNTYSENFRRRCDEPGDYSVHVFVDAIEEVSWNVAGYLLAWRIALAPEIGSVEYKVSSGKYIITTDDDVLNDVTSSFVKDQNIILAKGQSTE